MAATDPLAEFLKCLEELQPLASKVTALKDSTIEQETAALEKILEKIKPLLSIAAHKIEINYYFSGQQFHSEKEEYHQLKGLVLIDNFEKVIHTTETPEAIMPDGSWCSSRTEACEPWSVWATGAAGRESPAIGISRVRRLSKPEEAIRRYRLDELVKGLASEFNEAAKKLEKLQADYINRLELIKKVEEVLQ